jgi:ABC-type microcin C transport system permease subunit YejB
MGYSCSFFILPYLLNILFNQGHYFVGFSTKEIVAESFDMIVEENNVPFVVNIDDYPQKLNEIVEI